MLHRREVRARSQDIDPRSREVVRDSLFIRFINKAHARILCARFTIRADHGGLEEAQSVQRDTHLSRGQRIQEAAIIGTSSFFYRIGPGDTRRFDAV